MQHLEDIAMSREELLEKLNALRREQGVNGQVRRATLWRWLAGDREMNLAEAARIQRVTGFPAVRWSKAAQQETRAA